MPAHRKFQVGDVAYWMRPIQGVHEVQLVPTWVVITDYRQDGTGRGQYEVLKLLHPVNGVGYGPTSWQESEYLEPTTYPSRHQAVVIVRANSRLAERNCSCNCCAHEGLPRGAVKGDGTFRWE